IEMTLTDDQLDRYARHIVLKEIGVAGQGRLLESHVAIIGAGGIGNPAIQYLAAAGVGKLIVIDDEAVELRTEVQTSELQSLMSISYDVFCLKKKQSNIKT